jgi:hypothetical protein
VVAIAAALAVPSALAQVVLVRTVFRQTALPAGAVKAFTVTCKRGMSP